MRQAETWLEILESAPESDELDAKTKLNTAIRMLERLGVFTGEIPYFGPTDPEELRLQDMLK
jgi:hypothetical protein